MKNYKTKEDEVLRIQSLMGLKDMDRLNVIKKANALLNTIPRNGAEWKIKTKIILFTQMIITGVQDDKEKGVERLKQVLKDNPSYLDYFRDISHRLRMEALLS